MKITIAFVLVMSMLVAAAPALASYHAYVKIKPVEQSESRGSPMPKGSLALKGIPVLSLSSIVTPTSSSTKPSGSSPTPKPHQTTGRSTSQRQWEPVNIVKEWGSTNQGLGLTEIRCDAIAISAVLVGLKQQQGQTVRFAEQTKDGGCLHSIALPGQGPYKTKIGVTIPTMNGEFFLPASTTKNELKAGRTLAGAMSVSVSESTEKLSLH